MLPQAASRAESSSGVKRLSSAASLATTSRSCSMPRSFWMSFSRDSCRFWASEVATISIALPNVSLRRRAPTKTSVTNAAISGSSATTVSKATSLPLMPALIFRPPVCVLEPVRLTIRSRVVTKTGWMQGRPTTPYPDGMARRPDAANARFRRNPGGHIVFCPMPALFGLDDLPRSSSPSRLGPGQNPTRCGPCS